MPGRSGLTSSSATKTRLARRGRDLFPSRSGGVAYQSPTVNVNPSGERVVPGASQDPTAVQIWFFGGSTMWGTSSPDWGTIPAQFQRLAEEQWDRPLAVRNLGESAWVSTQSVIPLIQELQHGRVPDSVVFL
jgi:hypothetical protein